MLHYCLLKSNNPLLNLMTESNIKENWYYFRSLANQLQQTEQFVDHSMNEKNEMHNGSTFSNEFAKLLMLAAMTFMPLEKWAVVSDKVEGIDWWSDYNGVNSIFRAGKRTIATIGLDNIVIVDSDDALLVAAKGKIQDVKKVAEEIKGRGK